MMILQRIFSEKIKSYYQIHIVAFTLLLCLTISLPAYSKNGPDNNGPKKILVIHSYHPEYEWVSTISRGIKRVFELAKNIQVETIYMDTKRKVSREWKEKSGRQAREVISQWDPDVIITVDDNAQEYVGRFYVGKERPKIVFCGVNSKAEKYGYPASNVTGILERPHIKETLELLQQVVPNLKRVAVISDNSPTSLGVIEYIKEQSQTIDKEFVAYDMPITFPQWKSRITAYQKQADAILLYMYHTIVKEGGNESMPSKKIMEWTVANSAIPVIGFFPFSVDDGALLGVVESGIEYGREAALIAMALIEEESIQKFPMKTATKRIVMYNKQTGKNLGFAIDDSIENQIDIIVGE